MPQPLLRITGGKWRGRKIKLASSARPPTQRLRQSLFDKIGARKGGKVLDLFAGSGVLGLEALSRGASFCLFVEKNKKAVRTIRENCTMLGCEQEVVVFQKDAFLVSEKEKSYGPFDLIFCDPPFSFFHLEPLLEKILRDGFFSSQGICILRSFKKIKPFGKLVPEETRIVGDNALYFFYAKKA